MAIRSWPKAKRIASTSSATQAGSQRGVCRRPETPVRHRLLPAHAADAAGAVIGRIEIQQRDRVIDGGFFDGGPESGAACGGEQLRGLLETGLVGFDSEERMAWPVPQPVSTTTTGAFGLEQAGDGAADSILVGKEPCWTRAISRIFISLRPRLCLKTHFS